MSTNAPDLKDPHEHWISSREAARLLGVERRTIYSYVSRGLIHRCTLNGTSWYNREDVERLKARSQARRGHRAVAAEALHWGEPVLDTSIVRIEHEQLSYRGMHLESILSAGWSFERVVDLLLGPEWSANWPDSPPLMNREPIESIEDMIAAVPHLSEMETQCLVEGQTPGDVARLLVQQLGALIHNQSTASLATTLVSSIPELRCAKTQAQRLLEVALIVSAEHGTNASTFAARIASSAGANLSASLGAAICVMSGTRHGGAGRLVEFMFNELEHQGIGSWFATRIQDEQLIPGFHHPLYPHGDPRARLLLEALLDTGLQDNVSAELECIDFASTHYGIHPTIDTSLVVLRRALGARTGTSMLWFVLGRAAGWLAHALEQRESQVILRPRTRYRSADSPGTLR